MTKQEFIEKMTEKVEGLTKKDAKIMIDAVGEIVFDAVVANDYVVLPGVGKFSSADVAERTSRNPQTGEPLVVPAHKRVKFSATKPLKDALR